MGMLEEHVSIRVCRSISEPPTYYSAEYHNSYYRLDTVANFTGWALADLASVLAAPQFQYEAYFFCDNYPQRKRQGLRLGITAAYNFSNDSEKQAAFHYINVNWKANQAIIEKDLKNEQCFEIDYKHWVHMKAPPKVFRVSEELLKRLSIHPEIVVDRLTFKDHPAIYITHYWGWAKPNECEDFINAGWQVEKQGRSGISRYIKPIAVKLSDFVIDSKAYRKLCKLKNMPAEYRDLYLRYLNEELSFFDLVRSSRNYINDTPELITYDELTTRWANNYNRTKDYIRTLIDQNKLLVYYRFSSENVTASFLSYDNREGGSSEYSVRYRNLEKLPKSTLMALFETAGNGIDELLLYREHPAIGDFFEGQKLEQTNMESWLGIERVISGHKLKEMNLRKIAATDLCFLMKDVIKHECDVLEMKKSVAEENSANQMNDVEAIVEEVFDKRQEEKRLRTAGRKGGAKMKQRAAEWYEPLKPELINLAQNHSADGPKLTANSLATSAAKAHLIQTSQISNLARKLRTDQSITPFFSKNDNLGRA
tara:strand:+ start:15629 stop:17242 length:1614 start_codon:yes stop_codon:yes gene_type:complete